MPERVRFEPEELATVRARSGRALRTAVAVRRAARRVGGAEQVAVEHRDLCEGTRSFGVPMIVLDGGKDPGA